MASAAAAGPPVWTPSLSPVAAIDCELNKATRDVVHSELAKLNVPAYKSLQGALNAAHGAAHVVVAVCHRAGGLLYNAAVDAGATPTSIKWVAESRKRGTLVDPAAVPLAPLAGICITPTNLQNRDALRNTIEDNGGTYSGNLRQHHTHVLLAGAIAGPKWDHSLDWHIPIVTKAWLDKCVSTQVYHPVEDYLWPQSRDAQTNAAAALLAAGPRGGGLPPSGPSSTASSSGTRKEAAAKLRIIVGTGSTIGDSNNLRDTPQSNRDGDDENDVDGELARLQQPGSDPRVPATVVASKPLQRQVSSRNAAGSREGTSGHRRKRSRTHSGGGAGGGRPRSRGDYSGDGSDVEAATPRDAAHRVRKRQRPASATGKSRRRSASAMRGTDSKPRRRDRRRPTPLDVGSRSRSRQGAAPARSAEDERTEAREKELYTEVQEYLARPAPTGGAVEAPSDPAHYSEVLSGCVVYLVGGDMERQRRQRSIVRLGSGSNARLLTAGVTHVVVTPAALGDDFSGVIEASRALQPRPDLVKPSWLVDSVSSSLLAEEADHSWAPTSGGHFAAVAFGKAGAATARATLTRSKSATSVHSPFVFASSSAFGGALPAASPGGGGGGGGGAGAGAGGERPSRTPRTALAATPRGGDMVAPSRLLSATPQLADHRGVGVGVGVGVDSQALPTPKAAGDVLNGVEVGVLGFGDSNAQVTSSVLRIGGTFTVALPEVPTDSQETALLKSHVIVARDGCSALVTRPALRALCMAQDKVAQDTSGAGDTTTVDDLVSRQGAQLASVMWLRRCKLDKKLYDPASHRLFRPLRFRTPYPTMEGLIVSISIYADRERRLIMKLAELLGATTMQTLEPKVAFLICPRPEGSKYAAALKWGIHVVTSQWLYDSATKGEAQKPDLYMVAPAASSFNTKELPLTSITDDPQLSRSSTGTSGAAATRTATTTTPARKPLPVEPSQTGSPVRPAAVRPVPRPHATAAPTTGSSTLRQKIGRRKRSLSPSPRAPSASPARSSRSVGGGGGGGGGGGDNDDDAGGVTPLEPPTIRRSTRARASARAAGARPSKRPRRTRAASAASSRASPQRRLSAGGTGGTSGQGNNCVASSGGAAPSSTATAKPLQGCIVYMDESLVQRELSATAQFDAVAAVAALGGTCTHADPTSPSVTHAVLGGSTFFEHSRPARAAKRQGKVMFTLEAFKSLWRDHTSSPAVASPSRAASSSAPPPPPTPAFGSPSSRSIGLDSTSRSSIGTVSKKGKAPASKVASTLAAIAARAEEAEQSARRKRASRADKMSFAPVHNRSRFGLMSRSKIAAGAGDTAPTTVPVDTTTASAAARRRRRLGSVKKQASSSSSSSGKGASGGSTSVPTPSRAVAAGVVADVQTQGPSWGARVGMESQIIDYGGPTATPTQDTQGSPGNSGGSGGSQPQQRPRIASLLSSTLRDSAAGAVESTAATAKYEPS